MTQSKSDEKWPNFLLISPPKTGTTTIYEYFKQIPQIFMPSEKEPHYFALGVVPFGFTKPMNKKEYLSLFKHVKNESVIGEASTSYLSNPDSAQLIFDTIPNVKLIIILRNPIQRAISDYLWNYRVGDELKQLEDAVKRDLEIAKKTNKIPQTLEYGLYSKQVKKYLDIFPSEQIMFVIFEEFIKNPQTTIYEILEFLGISNILNLDTTKTYNEFRLPRGKLSQLIVSNKSIGILASKIFPSSGIRRVLREKILEKKGLKPKLSVQQKISLEKFYASDFKELEKILGFSLHWIDSE